MLRKFNQLLRLLFFAIVVKFVVLILIGMNIRNRQRLPKKGPAIVVANHNSHLDTLVLTNLFPLSLLSRIHPVAAADYFLKGKIFPWFSRNIIGIIPISRQGSAKSVDPLIPCYQALDDNQILIIFPEGTRGEPEQLSSFKKGIAYIAEKYPHVPVVPVFMRGLGRALPKGDYVLVPFFCDVYIGDAIYWQKDKDTFMKILNESFDLLAMENNRKQKCD